MKFALLGPVAVGVGDEPVALRAGIPRTILAILLLNANQVVSGEHLAAAVWGDDRPAAAPESLRNHVSRLRRQLGAEAGARVRTVAPGYLVEVRDGELDGQVFLDGCRQGWQALQAGDRATAADVLASALALWRGTPFAGMPTGPGVDAQLQQLEESRMLAWERRIEADLQLGRHRELIGELRVLTGAHPLREALHGQLMLALYRAGRQAEALDVYQVLRATLIDELGVEPSTPAQELHRRILDADPVLAADPLAPGGTGAPGAVRTGAGSPAGGAAGGAAAAGPSGAANRPGRSGSRYQLPADTRAFTGRAQELDQLLALTQEAARGAGAGMVVISAIDGMAGIGKSALAIHTAHRMREDFPDGQLFVDLHGHTPGLPPLAAGDALDWFLRSLGVPPQLIPQDLDKRSAFYRDRLAGTRTLIVLDNAASTAQVRPLLPGTPGCLVVVTSRRRLTGLDDAHTVALDVLLDPEAVTLLHSIAGPGRIPEGHPAVGELIALCGHMPLAVRITAARLRHHRALRIEDVVEQLRDEHSRLDYLQDEDRNLGAAFESSYTALPAAEQLLFRRLALVPGPDLDAHAAAELLGTDRRSAVRLLESLLDHNLLTQHTAGRYRFHDLVRLYSRELGERDPEEEKERSLALDRLLDHYRYAADTADRHVARHTRPGPSAPAPGPPATAPALPDQARALAWMRAERDNLLACVALAAELRRPATAVALTEALAGFLHQEGPWEQAAVLHRTAADTAHRLGDRVGEAGQLFHLGRIRLAAGDTPAAIELYGQALAIYQERGECLGVANVRCERGRAHYLVGDYPAASEDLDGALLAYRSRGERLGEANTLCELGRLGIGTSEFIASVGLLEQALAIFEELGSAFGEGTALFDLGRARHARGDFQEAIALQRRAVAIFTGLGTRNNEAYARWCLGRVLMEMGDLPGASVLVEEALTIFQDLGSGLGEGNALQDLGRLRLLEGDCEAASDLLERSVARFRELDSRLGAANALQYLAHVRHAMADPASLAAAAELLEQSSALYRELGDRQGEAEVLNSTGALVADTEGPDRALALYREALAIAREIESALDEAKALEGAARCAARTGDRASALADLTRAIALYRRMGAVEGAAAEAFLAELEQQGG